MSTNDLTDLMREGERHHAVAGPDLDAIRRRGGRRRRVRRAATGFAAVAAAAVVTGAVVVGTHGHDGDRAAQETAQDHQVTGLTAYEKRVLAAVPDSYAVDGTVVVPGLLGGDGIGADRMPADRITSPIEPLGFHAYAKGWLGYPYLPAFMHSNPPAGSQVIADLGDVYLACTQWPQSSYPRDRRPVACLPSVLGEKDGAYYYVYGLGADDFLKPGAKMEVFIDADYSDHVYRTTVIGGLDGTGVTRVEITTVDGQTVAATVDSGGISPGDTMFWATLPSDAASVTAYDANGDVVATHEVRSCHSPVDCEVR